MPNGTPSADDLLGQMNAIAPAAGPAAPTQSTQPPAQAQSSAPSSDDLLTQMNTIAPPKQTGTSGAPAGTTAGGVIRNLAAGELEGASGTINALLHPSDFVLHPLLTGLAGLYDIGAHTFGYTPLTPEQRADLTGEDPNYLQLGTRIANAAGASSVVPQSEAERLVRAGAAGAMAGAAGPGGLVTRLAAGVGGGVGGQAAADYAPDWASPYAQLGGMLAGGGAAGLGMAGLARAGTAGVNALRQAASGPVPVNPLDPQATVPGSANWRNLWTGEPDISAPAPATPPSPAAVPATGAQPAGAAITPPGLATLTPAETAAYQATAEGNKLLENQRIGEPDRTAYIPGVTPNSVEQEQTANAARELKVLGITSAEASDAAKLAAQSNNDARTSYWQDTARSPVDIQKAEDARAQQAQADLKAAWANKTDADASPVQDAANQILAGPDGKRKAVQSAVNSVLDELTDKNGNLETDPEILYGVRKHIGDMLSKEGQRETPLAARATDSLTTLRDTLDGVIEQAAPGFKQYLKNYSDASKPIDEMNVLQDATPKLFQGPNATMRYSDFQRFMKNVVDMRQAQGVNPYRSISDDTMQRLWNLRDDLRRSASAMELARAAGSDTAPNIIDAIKQYGKLGGSAAIDAAAAHIFGPAGPVMVRGARAMLAPITAQRTARAQAARMQQMLYPSNPLTPPPNALQQPSSNPLNPP